MTIASDVFNRLSDDATYINGPSAFHTAVFSYGMGVVELVDDWGYKAKGPDEKLHLEIEADLDAAEVYIEGQAMPAPIESTDLEVAFTPKAFRGVVRESGHERRARGSLDQGARFPDAQRKVKRAIAAIKNKIAKTLDDAATYGMQGQVSQTTNYGDQSRTTYSKFKPYKLDASSADVSTALLNKWWALGMDDPYGANPDVVLISATQFQKIAELGSGKLSVPDAQPIGGFNLVPTALRVGTAPVMVMPNISTSTLFGLTGATARAQGLSQDANTGSRTWGITWHEENPGRFAVLDLGANNTDTPMNIQISTDLTLAHTNPNEQTYLTGLSTG